MTSVITGDIIKSRNVDNPNKWLVPLKGLLKKITPTQKAWEIFRGDSFQVEIPDPREAFLAAVRIKSVIKSVNGLDVRISIGVGKKRYRSFNISESTGEAFIFSGEQFELLKKEKINLAIKTKNLKLNEELNLYFRLMLIAMDNWTTNAAEIVNLNIANPDFSQKELGELIGIKQNSVSERQKRAFLEDIFRLDKMYRNKIEIL
ncbi:transcriptional regulator [Galbibacter sp. EGI 63066]|uniref:transcriptional regulator n=1 Tax=Galbibacter sp. EGI 63066 TaxID=2993559 RepID=UPI002249336B|nr:transcriptional regulator [Galbibacter sp. EGI 63066]MCX2678518.1 transcriptional regulator [Galbibacter sp. EGI 63066]